MCKFDTTQFNILGISSYLVMALIGCACSITMYLFLQFKRNITIKKSMAVIAVALMGSLLGAKILGIIVNILNALIHKKRIVKETFINSGIVYYGGLFGLLLFFRIGLKLISKEKMSEYRDILAVIIPIFHFFGRIGCFFSGCCYGKITNSNISVIYTNKIDNTIVTASRIPTQLIEAGLNFVLFLCILICFLKNMFKEHLLYLYFISYGIVRFCIEFYRGDEYRGIYGVLSISQYISIVLIVIGGIGYRNFLINRVKLE